jgi:hypothetical protein
MPIELAQNARSFSWIELLGNLFFLYMKVLLDAAFAQRVCATL